MKTAQELKRDGYKTLIADHCELVDQVADLKLQMAAQDARIADLEYVVIEELLDGILRPTEPYSTTTPEDVERQMTGLERVVAIGNL